jgi:hypothetical protein
MNGEKRIRKEKRRGIELFSKFRGTKIALVCPSLLTYRRDACFKKQFKTSRKAVSRPVEKHNRTSLKRRRPGMGGTKMVGMGEVNLAGEEGRSHTFIIER